MTIKKSFLAVLFCSSLLLPAGTGAFCAESADWERQTPSAAPSALAEKPGCEIPTDCRTENDGVQIALIWKKGSKAQPSDQKKPEKAPAKAPATTGKDKAGESKAPAASEKPAPEKTQTEAAALQPDAALISVLRDLLRALKESPDVAKLEDACQKSAVLLATEALEKALDNPKLPSNRIVTATEKTAVEKSISAESWDSGEIAVSPNCHASLNTIWAKKLDGLLNLAITGNCACKAAPDGSKVGEFVFVLSGKSAIDKGFDIQSQADVNFWLGKLTGFSVDTACCSDADSGVKTSSQKATLVLKALVTERTRQYLAAEEEAREHQNQLALKAEEERKQAEKTAKEAEAKAKAEADAKAQAEEKAKKHAEAKAQEKGDVNSAAQASGASGAGSAAAGGGGQIAAVPPELPTLPSPAQVEEPRARRQAEVAMLGRTPEPVFPQSNSSLSNRGWDSPAPSQGTRMPSSSAQILLPDKAVAGQYLTAAVVNHTLAGEPSIELSFNGATLATSQDGKALYMVPDDATPGPTLQVAMSARPEQAASSVQILQPLTVQTGPQVPRVDRVSPVAQAGGVVVIDGHSFDGMSDRNRVIIDGMHDGRVLVSSPVQIKAELPRELSTGPHSISVSNGGPRSNPVQVEVVSFVIEIPPKNLLKDLGNSRVNIKVVGTARPVHVRIKNHTRDIMQLVKGNDQVVTTSGGSNNMVAVGAQRLQKGACHIEARLEQ